MWFLYVCEKIEKCCMKRKEAAELFLFVENIFRQSCKMSGSYVLFSRIEKAAME